MQTLTVPKQRTVWLRTSTLVILLLSACGKSPESLVAEGNQQLAAKKIQDAELTFRKALQSDDKLVSAHLGLGKALLAGTRGADAYNSLYRAWELEPQNPEARRLLAEFALAALLGGQRRPQQYYVLVAKIAQAELAQNPNGYAGWRLQGLLARLDRKPEEAEAAFRRALSAKPEDKEMTEALAALYWEWPGRESEGDSLLGIYSQKNPAQISARVLLAGRFAKSGRMQLAQEQLDALAGLPGGAVPAGDFFAVREDWDKALAYYAKAEARGGEERLEALKKRISLLNRLSRFEELAAALTLGLVAAPDDLDLQTAKALLDLGRNQAPAAAERLRGLLQKHADNATLHYHHARALLRLGQPENAEKAFAEAVRLSPSFVEPRLALVRRALDTGKPAEALRQMQVVLQVAPNNRDARIAEIGVLEAAGRWAEAQERLKVLRELYPRSGALALEQAILDLREKKYAEAERGLAPLYQPGQSDWRLLSSYARALVGNRKAATAVSILEKERKGAPDNQELGYVLAETYLVANDATRARALLEQMFAASQSFPPVGMRLANLQAKAGETDRARQTLSTTLAASPTRLEPLVQLGQLEERAGRWEAAKGHYRKILAAQPQNIFALNGLANLIAAHGPATELNEALGYARTAQQLAPRDPIVQATLQEVEARAGKR
ncbi:MAG: tetratricopeptide repeat protein [Bryobacter sp.]|nr:tetratricopeptide repeat protein [Bryobacter sp.]